MGKKAHDKGAQADDQTVSEIEKLANMAPQRKGGGMTMEELQKATGYTAGKLRRLLKAAKARGRLSVSRNPRVNLAGYVQLVPTYQLEAQ